MSTGRIGSLLLAALLLGGCAQPGVLRRLPDPVFSAPRQKPVRPPVARPAPPPKPAPPPPAPRALAGVTVVLDAGHGGKDPGAPGIGSMPEKSVNLAVTAHLASLLEAAGARVVLTRRGDRFLSLDARAAMAENTRADLFVSIHADAALNPTASGATVYIARSASPASIRAGRSIAAAIERAGIDCRGVKRAGFRVLVGHSRPAVLVECGFLTNPSEVRLLTSPVYQARIAEVIAEGVIDHFSGS